MTNLTRILNNQIYSKTIIASQKIADGTITGSLFSSNVTVPGDLLISGNLFVLGTSAYTTIASTNTYVNDPLITLNNGFSGVNTYDEGLVFNRGSLQNRALIWSEYYKEFRLIGTTEIGTTYGNVNVSNYANLHIGNLTVDYTINHTGDLFTNGFINTTGNISGAVGLFGSINSTGLINTTGNISASQVSVATLNATGLINTLGNISASEGSFATIKATGYINTSGNISTAQLNAGQINTTGNVLASAIIGASLNVSGNVNASTILAAYHTGSTATFGNISAVTIGNTGASLNGGTLNISGNVLLGLTQAAAINNTPIGNATPSTGVFTTVTAGQVSSGFIGNTGTQFTGASLNVAGNVNASTVLAQLVTADDATFGNVAALFFGNTGTQFTGASLNVSGNVLSAGSTTGALTVNGTAAVQQLTATGNVTGGLAQFASLNGTIIGNATPAAGTFTTLTAGQVSSGFIGNTGTAFTGASLNVTGNVLASTIGVSTVNATTLTATGNVIGGLAQFASINATPIGNATASTGAFTTLTATSVNSSGNVLASTVNAQNINISANVLAQVGTFTQVLLNSTANATEGTGSSGALQVKGGGSIAKDLWIGGNLYVSNIFATSYNVLTVNDPLLYLTAANTYPYNYEIGFYSQLVGGAGNIYQHSGFVRDHNDAYWKAFSNVVAEPGGTITFDADTKYDGIKAGNLLLVDTTASTSTSTGALVVSGGAGIAGAINAGSLNVSGNVNASTVLATLVRSTSGTFGNVAAGFIGNTGTAYTGASLNVSGNVVASSVLAQLVTADDATFGNVAAGFIGNTGTQFTGASLNVSGNVVASTVLAQLVTADDLTVGNVAAGFIGNTGTAYTGASINLSGNVLASAGVLNSLTVNGGITSTGYINTSGNISGAVINAGTLNATILTATGNVIGGLAQFASINSTPVGNATASTGAFTTLSASAGIWANSSTDSTSTSTGSIVSAGGLGLAGNIFQGGTQLQTSASNFIFATTPTTVDAFKAAATLNVGANSGTLTVGNPTVVGTQSTQNLYNTAATTLNFAGAATTLVAGATSGVAHLRNANIWLPNATSIDGAQTNVSLFSQYATNANLFILANVTIGGNVGSTTITNPLLKLGAANVWFSTGGTLDLAKTGITTLNFANDSTAITIAATTGLTSVRNSLEARGLLYANSATETSSSTTGGLVVYRGAGIGGSLNVANSAIFNSGLTTGTFQIKSSTSGNVALFANLSGGGTTTESIIIGGANTVVQSGVTLKIGSTTTMMVPVGPSSTRPSSIFGAGYDVAGMVRFNSSTNVLEFYDGSSWVSAGGTFTVISDRQFSGNVGGGFGNVDGTNTNFTLQSTSTTSATIVSINGVMQFPTLAYSVSGTTLTFTEPPAPGDVIDARILTTTTTISAISNTNGFNQILADNTGVGVWTGSASTVQRLLVDTGGNINVQAGSKLTYDQTPKQVTNTNLTLLDSFEANTYTTAKYVVSIKQGTGNVQAMESLVTTNGYGAWASTSTTVNTGNTMGTLVANVSGGTCSLWLIPNSGTAISNVKVLSTYIV